MRRLQDDPSILHLGGLFSEYFMNMSRASQDTGLPCTVYRRLLHMQMASNRQSQTMQNLGR